jgi:hypothetical protein
MTVAEYMTLRGLCELLPFTWEMKRELGDTPLTEVGADRVR